VEKYRAYRFFKNIKINKYPLHLRWTRFLGMCAMYEEGMYVD